MTEIFLTTDTAGGGWGGVEERNDAHARLMNRTFDLWSDGANSGPGKPGGWGAILIGPLGKLALSGYEASTTNNRMELAAVCFGLEAVGRGPASVAIHVDSAYVKNAFTKGWIKNWQVNGWRSYRGDAVANQDLWERLLRVIAKYEVTWHKVKGHGNTVLNNEADALAVAARKSGNGVYELTFPKRALLDA